MMKVGFLQFGPKLLQVEENIDKISQLVSTVKEFDLLVIPELANSGYVFTKKEELNQVAEEIPGGYFVEKLVELANEKNGYIVSGICEKQGAIYFNSSVLVGPDGYIGKYRKLHLFDREKLFFEPGDGDFEIFEIRGMKIGLLICWDWIFPEATRSLALRGMDLLAHSTNLVLSYCQTAMITRSIENRIFTITSNRIGLEKNGDIELHFKGQSQVTSPEAVRLAQAAEDTEEIQIVDIAFMKSRNKWMSDHNHIFEDRRPEKYAELVKKSI